jgi:hypothetical protein
MDAMNILADGIGTRPGDLSSEPSLDLVYTIQTKVSLSTRKSADPKYTHDSIVIRSHRSPLQRNINVRTGKLLYETRAGVPYPNPSSSPQFQVHSFLFQVV